MTFILDAYPLIVLLSQQEGCEKVEDLFQGDLQSPKRFLLSMINWGEIYYSILRNYGEESAEQSTEIIERLRVEVVPVDLALTKQAAIYKAGGGLSYADCFAAALAKRESATLVTGDPEFKRLEKNKEIKILWV